MTNRRRRRRRRRRKMWTYVCFTFYY